MLKCLIIDYLLGAKIVIDRSEDQSTNYLRKCRITGTAEQIKDAKGLLNEKIAEDTEIRTRRELEHSGSNRTRGRYDYKQSKL